MEVEKIDLYEVLDMERTQFSTSTNSQMVMVHLWCAKFSMGNNKGLYELAVLDKDGSLCYDTPITNDVIGSLKFEEAEDICYKISQLTTEEVDEFKKEKE